MSAQAWMTLFGLLGAAAPSSTDDAPGSFDAPPVVSWVRPVPGPPPPGAMRSELGRPVFHGDRVYVGSSQVSALLVLDRGSGDELASFPAAAPVQSAAVLGEDRVWFSDAAGYTWCYPLEGGTPYWSHFSGAPILSTPAREGGRLYVANLDNLVYALDEVTGELQWRHAQKLDPSRTVELQLYGVPSPVTVGGLVLTGHSDGTLVALDAEGGEVVWQRRVGEGRYPDLIAPPLVVDGMAYVTGYSEPMLAVDLDTRNVRWRLDIGGGQRPVVSGDTLYHGGNDGVLRAIDVVTGEILWTWDTGTQGALTEPIVTEAGLLVGSAVGGLYLVDPDKGTELWELEIGSTLVGVTVPPAVDGRQAAVLTNGGHIISLVVPE